MTAQLLAAREGRPSIENLRGSLERAREANAVLREGFRAERSELGADVAFLAPRIEAFRRVSIELGPEFSQLAYGMAHRLERMRVRAGSVVL